MILRSPVLGDITRGRATHAHWRERVIDELTARGVATDDATEAVAIWLADAPVIDRDVRGLLAETTDHGREVFVFTNGTDRVRAELAGTGLDQVLGTDGARLLNSADLGAAKPAPGRVHCRARRHCRGPASFG